MKICVFTNVSETVEATEENINRLLSTAAPIFVMPDVYLARRGFYRLLAKKLVWYDASRGGLMNDTSAVLGAWKHPPAYRLEKDEETGLLCWNRIRIYGDMYYDAYRVGSPNDTSWCFNTDAKDYSWLTPPDPEPDLIPRFRVLDLFFKLIGSPII